uniref:RNA polymerase sigma-70 region 2 domain-containing protein n=1 Tax=Prymnesium polylepis TaxID=72548 RepID=A0A7S4M3Q1_9EUKA
MLKAVNRFKPERGHRFSTYATWWIRTTVQRAVADQARTIRLPFGKSRLLSKAKRVHDELQQKNGRKPTETELASELQISFTQLRVLMQHWHGVGSLEAPLSVKSASSTMKKSTLLDAYKVRPQQQKTPQDVVEVQLVGECLRQQLQDELSPLEARVLQLRYGLEDGDCLSWKKIAERCDQPERQLQLAQTRALRKLRKQHTLRQLQQFCNHPEWESESMNGRVSRVG